LVAEGVSAASMQSPELAILEIKAAIQNTLEGRCDSERP